MHDHDDLQIYGLAMLMVARGRLYRGPDDNLYTVVPEVMPEMVEGPPIGVSGVFFSGGPPRVEAMMTWTRALGDVEDADTATQKRYRISSGSMELWADASGTLEQMDDESIARHACEWFVEYGQGVPAPARLMLDGEPDIDILP